MRDINLRAWGYPDTIAALCMRWTGPPDCWFSFNRLRPGSSRSGSDASNRSSVTAVDPAYTPWFEEYLDAFAARGRGESDDLRTLLQYYGVPLLLTSDDGAVALTTESEVLSAVRRQIDAMRAAGYHRSETLNSDAVALNATSALHTAEFSRQRADGSEIGRLRATYLITVGPNGRRISALAVHTR